MIRQAADRQDTTGIAFVLDTVTARAHEVVEQHRALALSNTAFNGLINELGQAPPAAVDELVDLFEAHPRLPET